MRRRRRYQNYRTNPATAAGPINDVKARDQLDVLERISKHHRHVLRKMRPLKWDTQRNVFLSLRSYLYWKMHWLDVRRKVIKLAKQTQEHYEEMKRQFGCHYTGYLMGVGSGESVGEVDAKELTIHRPRHEDYRSVCNTMDRHNKILADLQEEYTQMEPLLKLPEWRDISQHVCHGGRLAFSVALACHTGTLSRNKAPEHKMFGWNVSGMKYNYPEDKDHPMFKRVREVMRGMHPRLPPTKGQRPSMLEGWEILNKSDPYEPSLPPQTPANRFKNICRTSKSKAVVGADDYIFSATPNLEDSTPIMARYVREEVQRDGGKAMRIRNKVVRKIMQLREPTFVTDTIEEGNDDGTITAIPRTRCTVPRQETANNTDTIFLAMPTHMGGDDYIVPAMWATSEMSVTTGWVYMRRGWPDMYHIHILPTSGDADDDDQEVRRLEEPMPDWTIGYKWKSTAEKLAIIEANMPTPELVHQTLEQASATFFNRTRNKELKGLNQKQRYARILVKLRRLPCLTRQDSYGVSNCTPGTEQFIEALTKASKLPQLGDGKVVDGRRLALCWKRAKYIQEDRFANVVNKLYEPYQKELDAKAAADARLDQRIAECMESEGGGLSTGNPPEPTVYAPVRINSESQIAPDGSFIDLRENQSLPVQG